MDTNNILNLFEKCDFREGITEMNYHTNIIQHLPKDFYFKYEFGVSKLVIIPIDEDFVIKIPFIGEYDYDRCETVNFACANNDDKKCWDYCFTEVLYYHEAKKYKAAEILAKSRYIGTVQNYPIYIQQKVETYYSHFCNGNNNSNSDDVFEPKEMDLKEKTFYSKCSEKNIDVFNIKWMMDVFDYYGEKKFDKIMKFVSLLNDLHNNNIGYIGTRPIILDYAGWND